MASSGVERPLNSDELGDKGEKRFGEICTDAKLICNPSTRDRTGWDFIVEFPFTDGNKLTLDQRPAPLSAVIQMKTQWADSSHRFVMRLSAAERLAKDAKPTFVYVFQVDDDLEFAGAYLLPIRDKVLERILKRLRQEQFAGEWKINQKEISFDAADGGVLLEPTGKALRACLEQLCPDPQAYAAEKARQLAELGFGPDRYELHCTFRTTGYADLVDGFLGLRSLEATSFKSWEKRFGIKLLLSSSSIGETGLATGVTEVKISPQEVPCAITVFGRGSAPPARFDGQLLLPAVPVPRVHFKAVARCRFFQVELVKKGFNISDAGGRGDDARCSLSEWMHFLRALVYLGEGGATIMLSPEALQLRPVRATVNDVSQGREDVGRHKWGLKVIESAQRILDTAGAIGKEVTFMEIMKVGDLVLSLDRTLSGSDSFEISFHTELPQKTESQMEVDILYINHLSVAGVEMAYSATVKMQTERTGENMCWRSKSFTFRRLQKISRLQGDYVSFIEGEKTVTGITNYIFQIFEEITGTLSLEHAA